MMKKNSIKNLLSVSMALIMAFTICIGSISVSASTAAPSAPADVEGATYYLKEDFTATPSGTTTSPAGVSYTWNKASTTVYDSTYNAVKLQAYTRADYASALTTAGDYMISMDFMAPSLPGAMVNVKLNNSYTMFTINTDGKLNLCGHVTDTAITVEKWYRLTATVTLSSGAITAQVTDIATGEVILEKTRTLTGVTSISGLGFAPSSALSDGIYTQSWRLYTVTQQSGDDGDDDPVVPTVAPSAPADVEGATYYLKEDFTAKPSGTTTSPAGVSYTWNKASTTVYDSTYNAVKLQAYTRAGYASALTTAGDYMISMDFMAPSLPGAAVNVKLNNSYAMFTINTDGKLNLCGHTTETAITAGKWYRLTATVKIPSGAITAQVTDVATDEVILEKTRETTGVTTINDLGFAPSSALSDGIYTQSWRLYTVTQQSGDDGDDSESKCDIADEFNNICSLDFENTTEDGSYIMGDAMNLKASGSSTSGGVISVKTDDADAFTGSSYLEAATGGVTTGELYYVNPNTKFPNTNTYGFLYRNSDGTLSDISKMVFSFDFSGNTLDTSFVHGELYWCDVNGKETYTEPFFTYNYQKSVRTNSVNHLTYFYAGSQEFDTKGHIDVVVDFETGSSWYYLNGKLYGARDYSGKDDNRDISDTNFSQSDKKFLNNCYGIRIKFRTAGSAPAAGRTFNLDNLQIAVRNKFKVKQSYPESNMTDVNVLNDTELVLTNPIETFSASDVTMTENGVPFTGFTASYDENKIIIKYPEGLNFGSQYVVSLGEGIKDSYSQILTGSRGLTFSTGESKFTVLVPEFLNSADEAVENITEAGNSVTAATKIKNPSSQERKVVLVAAAYDADGNITDLQQSYVNVPAEGAKPLETTVSAVGAVSVKAFVCDSEGLLDMTDGIFTELSDTVTVYRPTSGTKTVTFEKTELSGNIINISGKLSGTDTAVIKAVGKNKGLIFAEPILSGTDGSFACSIKLDTSAADTYTVSVGGYNVTENSFVKNYITDAQKETIRSAINSAASDTAVEKIMTENKALFNLDESVYNAWTYTIIYEQKVYDTFDEFIAQTENAAALLSKLNSADWYTLSSLIKTDSAVLLKNVDELAAYNNLSENKRNSICMALAAAAPYSSIATLRNIFAQNVNSAATDTPSNNGGGGGGGGGSNRSMAAFPTAETTATTKSGFNDLAGYEWAEDSIYEMLEKGVISPADSYRPGDNVTREEFVKLLVEALNITQKNGQITFYDVDTSAWYAGYIGAAYSAGIVTGNTDGSFGIGSNITRQDMAAMVYRAVSVTGKTLSKNGETVAFSDSASISDYAAEAVSAMQRAGIISGMGDGSFAPKSFANRAQAAVIIHNLLEAVR